MSERNTTLVFNKQSLSSLSTDAQAVSTAQVIFIESSGKVTLREVTNNRTILTVSERQGKSKSFTVLVQSYVYISAV